MALCLTSNWRIIQPTYTQNAQQSSNLFNNISFVPHSADFFAPLQSFTHSHTHTHFHSHDHSNYTTVNKQQWQQLHWNMHTYSPNKTFAHRQQHEWGRTKKKESIFFAYHLSCCIIACCSTWKIAQHTSFGIIFVVVRSRSHTTHNTHAHTHIHHTVYV